MLKNTPLSAFKDFKGHFTGIFENFVSSFTQSFNLNLAFWLSLKISQKQETEMILTMMAFTTIQEVSDLNIGSQSYFFAQL